MIIYKCVAIEDGQKMILDDVSIVECFHLIRCTCKVKIILIQLYIITSFHSTCMPSSIFATHSRNIKSWKSRKSYSKIWSNCGRTHSICGIPQRRRIKSGKQRRWYLRRCATTCWLGRFWWNVWGKEIFWLVSVTIHGRSINFHTKKKTSLFH